jgi:hypothetical protein
MGGFFLAAVNLGILTAKIIPGFSTLLNKEQSYEGTPPRITLTLGILLQIPFYLCLSYLGDEFIYFTLYDFEFIKEQKILMIFMLVCSFMLGYGLQVVEYAVKKYAHQCTWKEHKS